MRSGRILAAVLALALGAGTTATAVHAAHDDRGRSGSSEERRAGLISGDRAAEIARAATGGRVLRVQLRGGERPWYRVRVLVDDRRVRNVAVDARSGRLLE